MLEQVTQERGEKLAYLIDEWLRTNINDGELIDKISSLQGNNKQSILGHVERLDIIEIDNEHTLSVDFKGRVEGLLTDWKGKHVKITVEELLEEKT